MINQCQIGANKMKSEAIIGEVLITERINLSREYYGNWGILWRLNVTGISNLEEQKDYDTSIFFSSSNLLMLKRKLDEIVAEGESYGPPGESEGHCVECPADFLDFGIGDE